VIPQTVRTIAVAALAILQSGCCGHLMPSWLRGPARPLPPAPGPDEPMVLEEVWKVPNPPNGQFQGIDVEASSGRVFALFNWHERPEGWTVDLLELDRGGSRIGTRRLGPVPHGHSEELQVVEFDGQPGPEFLAVSDLSITAFTSTGAVLWDHERRPGIASARDQRRVEDAISEACSADLDADGRDEVIIAYLYSKKDGVVALNHDGSVRWRYAGNSPRHLCAGPTGSDGGAEVALPRTGLIVLDAQGRTARTLDVRHPGMRKGDRAWIDITRVAYAEPGGPPMIFASDWKGRMLAGLDPSGTPLWQRTYNDAYTTVMDLAAASDRPWMALGTWRCCRALVYDLRTGERLASIRIEGWPKLAWVPASGDQPPLLVVGSFWSITAYRMVERARAEPALNAPAGPPPAPPPSAPGTSRANRPSAGRHGLPACAARTGRPPAAPRRSGGPPASHPRSA
jgi:outer membrane protein assembly factor BamB